MATITVKFNAEGFIDSLATQLREAANRLQPIDRDELKAVIMSCGPDPAAAEVADVVVAWLGEV